MAFSEKIVELAEYSKYHKISNKLRNKELVNQLLKDTSFLPNNSSNMERLWYVNNNTNVIVKCLNCNDKAFWNIKTKSYNDYCVKCVKKSPETLHKRYQTNLIKYGFENPFQQQEKIKKTKNEKYGDPNYNNSDKMKETWLNKSKSELHQISTNIKKTKNEKYGNPNYNNVEKIKKTNNELYGGIGFSSITISKKIKNTMKNLYGNEEYQKTFDFWEKSTDDDKSFNEKKEIFDNINDDEYIISLHEKYKNATAAANSIGISYRTIIRRFIELDLYTPKQFKSILEENFAEFLESLNVNYITNTRSIITPLELDFYIPDHNLAIEINGLKWHSFGSGKDKKYHLNKTLKCRDKGIQLIHIFENEFYDEQLFKIWKSVISNKLGKSNRIYARKCEIMEVTPKDTKIFLEQNHLQGAAPSSINLGLYLNFELVALMTIGKSRFDKEIKWELIRFCNKLDYSVIGGAGKLFKYFIRHFDGNIVSYADMRRSNGNLYKNLGFTLSHESDPNYFYFKRHDKLESRVKYQKHKLKKVLPVFDPNLTEWENMSKNGFDRIYDCGNQVWIYKN